jgi:hypothetical protein
MDMHKKQDRKATKKIHVVVIIIIELLIYLSFMYIDITGLGSYVLSNSLKYTGILFCFFYTLLFYSGRTTRLDSLLLRGALLFTVISDLFLLILDYYDIGMMTFCIVQFFYLFRLYGWRKQMGKSTRIMTLLLRNAVLVTVLLLFLIYIKLEINLFLIVALIYFTGIILNTLDAVLIGFKTRIKNQLIFAIGMVLFLLCDINVGIYNLSGFITIDAPWFTKVSMFASIAMWMFYLPAQTAIALSGNQ